MASSTIEAHAERLLPAICTAMEETGDKLRAIIDTIYDDPEIAQQYAGATIQCNTVRATVAKKALQQLKQDQRYSEGLADKDINVMIIGDTEAPDDIRDNVHRKIDQLADDRKETLVGERGQSYNLEGRAPEWIRKEFFDYIDRHYEFPDDVKQQFIENSSLVPGGMSALRLILGEFMVDASRSCERPYIISSDTSFDMFWDIVEQTAAGNEKVETKKIATKQKNLLHLTPEDIDYFYDIPAGESYKDCWYIIPVSNYPSTKTTPENLHATCKRILHHNPNARIIMDLVYVRILGEEGASELMEELFNDPEILHRTVFIESFSKSHGMAGRRLGAYFTTNKDTFGRIHSHDRALGQGHPYDVYANISAITALDDKREELIKDWHILWGVEMKGLYKYLIESGDFDDLFHEDQSHIVPDQLESTVGIYLSLRLKEGITARDVLAKTGIAGMEFNGKSGKYIRFSVGKITEPTYSNYAT